MRVPGFYVICLLLVSCGNTPHSDFPIALRSDDELSTIEKIVLVENRVDDLNDDNMMAAVAILYERNGSWPSAYAAIQEAIKLSPLNAFYHTKKAVYAFQIGYFDVAYEEARIADELGFRNYQQDILLARLAVTMGDSASAASQIQNVVDNYSNNATVNYLSALLKLHHGDTAKSIQLFEASLDQQDEDEEVLVSLMNLMLELDSIKYAKRLLTQIDKITSKPESYYNITGSVYFQLGEIDSAIQLYKHAYFAGNDEASLKSLINIYWNMQEFDSALQFARYAEMELGAPRYSLLTQARVFDKMTAYDSSLMIYNRLFAKDTTDSLVGAEMKILQRKIAYLRRRKQEQKKLADSLSKTMPVLSF
jgi:tetratricopeptide (TPR) repeat protein